MLTSELTLLIDVWMEMTLVACAQPYRLAADGGFSLLYTLVLEEALVLHVIKSARSND